MKFARNLLQNNLQYNTNLGVNAHLESLSSLISLKIRRFCFSECCFQSNSVLHTSFCLNLFSGQATTIHLWFYVSDDFRCLYKKAYNICVSVVINSMIYSKFSYVVKYFRIFLFSKAKVLTVNLIAMLPTGQARSVQWQT